MNRSIKTMFTIMISLSAAFAAAGEIKTLELKPAKGMTRANLSYIEPAAGSKPRGFLLLASGYNSDGTFIIKKPEWREFAKKFGLIPVGLSFASELPNLRDGTGYYLRLKWFRKSFAGRPRKDSRRRTADIHVRIFGRGALCGAVRGVEAREGRGVLRLRRRMAGLPRRIKTPHAR